MSKLIIVNCTEGTVEGHGFKGKECLEKTKAFEEALGAVKDRKNKAEMYQAAIANPVTQKIGGG